MADTVNGVMTVTGLVGVASMLLGAPRLGGALFAVGGTYALLKGSKTQKWVGGAYEIVGAGTFFLPEIRGALSSSSGGKLPSGSTPTESNNPPIYYASMFDEDIGGGWTLLDARDIEGRNANPDQDAHVGMTASLILQNKNGPLKVFNAKIIGISGDDYSGVWSGGSPSGGPQAIDFRGANIYTLHA